MDQCNKDLAKKPINWTDLEKQIPHIQTRIGATSVSGIPSHSISINKILVKQCTDLLIKHIKKLNQAQVIDQLENLAQSCNLLIYKTPSEEDPNTLNAFLTTDDFYFEVTIALSGEITDAKFSIFSEPATSSTSLKDIFCSWNWDLLSKHIEGIKSNFILSDSKIRPIGFKAIQCLEKDLSQLYQFVLKYFDKVNGTKNNFYMLNQQSNFTDKLINQTPVGVFKKSELGQPLRLYYYLSPLDLIQHHQNVNNKFEKKIDPVHNSINNLLSTDELFSYELGSYLSVSLVQSSKMHKLIDKNLLVLTDNDDERTIFEYLNPYINQNFNIEKTPLFLKSSQKQFNSSPSISATFQAQLNKPVVMCLCTLKNLHEQIGIEVQSETIKPTPFFELLAKTAINNKIPNDAYSVQLPDENQVYYITELDETSCMGVTVDKISFTNPQDLILIIDTLRKQLLFNELLLSCMRRLCTSALNISNNNYNLTNYNYTLSSSPNVRILEIGLIAPFVVSVIMQHPKLMCYTTIEIDVSQGSIETRFRDHNDLHNPNVISEIIRRCHSIPVTIRALLMKYKQNSALDTRRKTNNSNFPDDNGKNSRNNPNNNQFNKSDDNFDQTDQYMTTENDHFSNTTSDEMQIRNYSSDNYQTTPFNKQELRCQKTKNDETQLEDESKNEFDDELDKSKSDGSKLKSSADSSGMAKKRKASASSTSDSTPSNTPNTLVSSTNPPSAKRKMIQNQSNDIKRHNSMNEDSRTLNGNSSKKQKLKPSLSSIDVGQKIDQSLKKSEFIQKTPQNTLSNKKDTINVLTSSNSIKTSKESKSIVNKTSSSTNQVKKTPTSSTPGQKNSLSNNNVKLKSEETTKAKICKDKSQKSSTPGKNLNISNTEIQLKQQQQSPQVNLSSTNLINSSSDKIRDTQQLNHRTPSPSPSSLSSLSMSTSLISPSNDYLSSDIDSNLKYEPTLISKPKLKQIKDSEMKKNSKNFDIAQHQSKPNTPPNKPSIALSLGLSIGTSLKGGFKIPHKTKSANDDEDNLKNPLSSSSPIVKNALSSPNKSSSSSSSSPQYDPTAPSLLPVKNLNNKNSNRPNTTIRTNFSKNNTNCAINAKSSTQRPSGQTNRPPTPVPHNKKTPPVPLMTGNKIQPLMSFSTTIQSSDMTPSSPSPQDQQSMRKKCGTPQPPDSPVSESNPDSVKPKVIPLERNTVKSNKSKQSDKNERDDYDENSLIENTNLFMSTFSTRNISNNSEVLSSLAVSSQKIGPYVPTPAARLTNSPGILEEDLVNGALTS